MDRTAGRPYQVEPETVATPPKAARVLGEFGVKILSVAGLTDEATMAALCRGWRAYDPGDGAG